MRWRHFLPIIALVQRRVCMGMVQPASHESRCRQGRVRPQVQDSAGGACGKAGRVTVAVLLLLLPSSARRVTITWSMR